MTCSPFVKIHVWAVVNLLDYEMEAGRVAASVEGSIRGNQ